MRIGVTMFSTDYAVPPHELAVEAEKRGFTNPVWFPSTATSRPAASRRGPAAPSCRSGTTTPTIPSLPSPPRPSSPRPSSSAPASAWSCSAIPSITAKEVATADRLSNGRVLFGVGGGWTAQEMEDHGTAFATRFKLMRERVEAMKEIWARSEPKYALATCVKFDEMCVAQAGAGAASADHRRRRPAAWRAPRRRLRRRLDADRRPRRRHARTCCRSSARC